MDKIINKKVDVMTRKVFILGALMFILWISSLPMHEMVLDRESVIKEVQTSSEIRDVPDWFYKSDISDYRLVDRATKYAILFIVVTFLSFFLFEIIVKLNVHPFQYLLVGSAVVVFYMLLLSFSEHIGFNLAYLLGATMTTGLITLYSKTFLKKTNRSYLIGIILSLTYGYLFIVLQMESYALLFGSLLLFSLVATTMYVTRKVDWYQIG